MLLQDEHKYPQNPLISDSRATSKLLINIVVPAICHEQFYDAAVVLLQ
jgi:hypothetical protein